MSEALTSLQNFFRDLFQFDLADLDFGLYRIYHLRRAEIEKFIEEQLPREVDAAFESLVAEQRDQLQKEQKRLVEEIHQNVGSDAILPSGEVKEEYRTSKVKIAQDLIPRYESVRDKIRAIQVTTEGQKAEVFNYLYEFFSRYYEEGDFIPKRRYGKDEVYAVPYNGEEVFFYWANRDQYYVKTSERFRDYAFKVKSLMGTYRVRFMITRASVPRDNVKGQIRYFFPCPEQITWDAARQELHVPFEHRLPTAEEAERYGTNSKAQEAILQEALPSILATIPDENLRALLREDQRTAKQREAGEPELPLLLKRLRHFCRRNTGDFFVHKDLRGFLRRELEFYIKDRILHVMDTEADLEARRRVLSVFRVLAGRVIDFLAQIEEVQKVLFEKKKFILGTDYLIPIQYVPRDFWGEVLANHAQLAEWRAWGMLETETDEISAALLENLPTLPLHTRHFERDFVYRLLEALPFDDLDEATDGLLVYGENWQALNLLQEVYRGRVKCIYIDPPYNTGQDGFVYKDAYQHSSWLSMLESRLHLARELMSESGLIFVSIDDNEVHSLRFLLNNVFGKEAFKNIIIIRRGPKNVQAQFEQVKALNVGHEYVLLYGRKPETTLPKLFVGESRNTGSWNNHWRGTDRPTMRYELFGIIPERGQWRWGRERSLKAIENYQRLVQELGGDETRISQEMIDEWWRSEVARTGEEIDLLRLSRSGTPEHYVPPSEGSLVSDLWSDIQSSNSRELFALFASRDFPNPKGTDLVQRVLSVSNKDSVDDWTLDFFAGSGTTGHAVINLNRKDGGRRKFILVEMAEYFDTILLPRIAKVIFTPDWREGKPRRLPTPEEAERGPRLVKILRLESYEDALHNLAVVADREKTRQREAALRNLTGDEYPLYYWLSVPVQEAETCLRALDLAHPFCYALEVLTDEGPIRKPVDLVETFDYLYGLRVQKIEALHNPSNGGHAYRLVHARDREGKRKILVIWRDLRGIHPEDERRFLEDFIRQTGQVWDEILINGDVTAKGIQSLDPLFKQRMMAISPTGGSR